MPVAAEGRSNLGSSGLERIVSQREVILPQLSAPGVAAHQVRKLSSFKALFGPIRAEDLPAYLDNGMKATAEMRSKSFTAWERFVLIPVELVDALKAYLDGKGANPHERQKTQMEQRMQAEQAIAKRLGSLRKKWFLKLLNQAKDTAPAREDCIADMGLGYPQLRRLLTELGRRLVAGGALAQPEDIYWLEAQEVDALAIDLGKLTLTPFTSDPIFRP